ncbi:histone deacetylase family protein [Facilibium subflavum]|uniref:histone deacetylase family protein n=1 Tax=Facilibium subflavum TaxID=2219058 RepID=UPI000E65AC0A|nr:hypothetical protein [Facilibium subflavum]
MSKTLFVHNHALFKNHLNFSGSPEKKARLDIVEKAMKKAQKDGFIDIHELTLNTTIHQFDPLLSQAHPLSHIKEIQQSTKAQSAIYPIDAITQTLHSILDEGCRYQTAFCATRPPGHHSYKGGVNIEDQREGGIDCGEGYCYYNNAAIAALYAHQHFNKKHIMIIDFDYHHGNGTQNIFFSAQDIKDNRFTARFHDPLIYFISSHNADNYPYTPSDNGMPCNLGTLKGKANNTASYIDNIHLPQMRFTDQNFLHAFKFSLDQAFSCFHPDLIILSAGFDARHMDPIARFLPGEGLTDKAYFDLTLMIKQQAYQQQKNAPIPIISILEGGYNVEGDGFSQALYEHLKALSQPLTPQQFLSEQSNHNTELTAP